MSDEKRYTPSVSLKDSEKQWLEEQAKKAGVSYTRYMRKVALCELAQAETPLHKKDQALMTKNGISPRELEKVLNFELPKIGNNLNQLTRHVNATRQIGPRQLEEIQMCREEIALIGRVILKALG